MDVFSGSAQGAVDSLLGILVSVIVDEARLLGNVRGDVQFIKDEMESMNGFLLHIGEASEDNDHQVRAWLKQIRDVAIESERWVEQFQHWADKAPYRRGPPGYLLRILYSLFTISERHDIATKIKELRARAHEVGERRNRYGVEVPPRNYLPSQDLRAGPSVNDEKERYAQRRNFQAPILVGFTEEDMSCLTRWLTQPGADIPRVRLIQVVRLSKSGKDSLKEMLKDRSLDQHFQTICWIPVHGSDSLVYIMKLLLSSLQEGHINEHDGSVVHSMINEVRGFLEYKRFLVVFDGIDKYNTLMELQEILEDVYRAAAPEDPSVPGSAILVLAKDHSTFESSCYRSLNKVAEIVKIYEHRAAALLQKPVTREEDKNVLNSIMTKLAADFFCLDILLRHLFSVPELPFNQLISLEDSLQYGGGWDNTFRVLLLCYNGLQPVYRTCLLYLCIYPKGTPIRRTCLLRRWVADGLVSRRAGLTSADAAEGCVSALLDRGFLRCCEQGAAEKAKFVMVPDAVFLFIMETARTRADNYTDMNIPPELAHRISVGSGIQLQQVARVRRSCLGSLITNCIHGIPASEPDWENIIALLESLPTTKRLGLLKVLDLESCGSRLSSKCLKNICHISELRYLNLRGTSLTELPKDINKLQNLETLDIRETKVTALPANIVYLRKVKHLLSSGSNISTSVVSMPDGIGNMMGMQILSHVAVSCDANRSVNQYDDIVRLRKLRKFGVVIKAPGEPQFLSVMHAIEKLDRCLRSLSIQLSLVPLDTEGSTQPNRHLAPRSVAPRDRAEMITLPVLLQSLTISGFREGLPYWALKPNQLVKVTLKDTSIQNRDIQSLGVLPTLCVLRLRHITLSDAIRLVFQKDEFQNLKLLVLENTNIVELRFDERAAPKLENLAWSNSTVHTLSGIDLPRLVLIDFTGSRVSEHVYISIANSRRSEFINVIRSTRG